MAPSLTVIVATKNEEKNIARCLASVAAAQRVVVVDSGSTDRTISIATAAHAEVVSFVYHGGYPKKRQWALDNLQLATDWILLLDADEVIPATLWAEMVRAMNNSGGDNAYLIKKSFHFLGRRLRFGGFSHSAVLLFRRGKARFEEMNDGFAEDLDMEVHERILTIGSVGRLQCSLIHEDFKGLTSYLDKHNKYSTWESGVRHGVLYENKWGPQAIKPSLFGDAQQLRRLLKQLAIRVPLEPILWFIYHYIVCLGMFEGRRGWIASVVRMQYISNVRSKLYERSL